MPPVASGLRVFTAELPFGKKGQVREYRFEETFRASEGACRETWDVRGGQYGTPYQLVFGEQADGTGGWKCDCPDAIFRDAPDKKCKHLAELLRWLAETDGIWWNE
jgi:hypothetical protein